MTAPLPKMSTVLVLSEKGSRLSLPSTARAPLIVTGTSNATGCCLMAASPGEVEVVAGRCAASGLADEIPFSLNVGGMACTLAKEDSACRPVPDRAPLTSICSPLGERASHSTCVLHFARNTCPSGQVKIFAQGPERRAWIQNGCGRKQKNCEG